MTNVYACLQSIRTQSLILQVAKGKLQNCNCGSSDRKPSSARVRPFSETQDTRTASPTSESEPKDIYFSDISLHATESLPPNLPMKHHGSSSTSSDLHAMPSDLPALDGSDHPPPVVPPRSSRLKERESYVDSQPQKTDPKVKRLENNDRRRLELACKFRYGDHS